MMDEIRRLATRMNLGGSLPCIKFFEPTKKFLCWMKRRYSTSLIYDVGAGLGHVAKALRENGLKALAIDLNYRDSGDAAQVLIADGESYRYEPDSVVMVCRPCHGCFTEQVIEQSSRCDTSAFLYVGLEKNVEGDLGVYLSQLKLVLSGAGEDGEGVWLAKKVD